jgi:D-3-phosphoglycerate dehydrogenase
VARWARAFGMQTIGFDPIVSASAARAAGIEPVPLDDLFAKCDFITLHTPLTKDTRNLIRAENLQKCKQGACTTGDEQGRVETYRTLRGADIWY